MNERNTMTARYIPPTKPTGTRNDARRINYTTNCTQADWLRTEARKRGMSVNALIRACVDLEMGRVQQ